MTASLIINPHFRVELLADDADGIIVSCAKRRVGVQTLRLSRSVDSSLFEIFSDAAGLEFIDPYRDFSLAERQRLQILGLIVEKEDQPQKPVFSCMLDEVEQTPLMGRQDDLIVNPTLRFEPFDLARFASRLNSNLSPKQPISWVRTPLADIELGYWLSPEQAEIVSRFIPGETVNGEIDPSLMGKLSTARILVRSSELAAETAALEARVADARANFHNFGGALFNAIFPEHQMAAMRRYYRQYVAEGFMPFGDPQVPGRYYQYNEPLAALVHKNLRPLMSLIVGAEVKPSYVYAASYSAGATLEAHRDRPQCEFSISFQVDFEPHTVGEASSWPLYVETINESSPPSTRDAASVDESCATAFYLKSGDGLFYKGHELSHFRRALPSGHTSTSLFFHYVPADFDGSLR
jgi:hypothetical protein